MEGDGRRGWYVVVCAFCIAVAGWGFGFYGPGIYLVALRAQHGWSSADVSLPITVYYLLGAVCIAMVGGMFERFGARSVVLGGCLAMSAGVVALTQIETRAQMFAAFAMMAVGWSAMSGAAVNTIVAPWFERRRGMAISLALNGASVSGIIVAPVLVSLVGRMGFAPGIYLALAVTFALLVPLVLITLVPPPGAAPMPIASDGQRWTWGQALRDRRFLTVSIPFALGLTAQVGFITHQLAYLTPILGAEPAGLCQGAASIAAVVGRMGMGSFIDRVDPRRIAALNFLMQVGGLALLLLGTPAALVIGSLVFGLGVGILITLPGLILQREFPARDFARLISLALAINQLTFAFGPALLGWLRDWSGGYPMAIGLCIGLDAVAAIIVLNGWRAVARAGREATQPPA